MEQQELNNNHEMTDNNTDMEAASVLNADENVAGTNNLNEKLAEESEIEKIQQELQEQKEKYLRLFAEFDNYKRRNARERLDLIQTAGREVIQSLLDVLDDCDRADKVMESASDIEKVKEGVALVFQKLRNSLEQKGLKPMQTMHTEFDADLHEAITEIPAPNDDLKGKVMDEVTKGYYLGDKIIRHAKVVVGK